MDDGFRFPVLADGGAQRPCGNLPGKRVGWVRTKRAGDAPRTNTWRAAMDLVKDWYMSSQVRSGTTSYMPCNLCTIWMVPLSLEWCRAEPTTTKKRVEKVIGSSGLSYTRTDRIRATMDSLVRYLSHESTFLRALCVLSHRRNGVKVKKI